MNRSLSTLIITAGLAALVACSSEPQVVTVNQFDPQAEALKNAPPVAAPPMMTASRAYRCRDNSLVYIEFYNNNTALVRTTRGGAPTIVTAADGQPPYTGSGYSVSANSARISYTSPARGTLPCHT